MIEDISIKDFALIDSLDLEFSAGFTVLSGETGAGKSILIGAISFLLGGKGGTELIRPSANEARVSGTLCFTNRKNTTPRIFLTQEMSLWLKERGIELENDRLLIRRIIRQSGKTVASIQNTPITRAELQEFTSWCLDIHGQHEHQSLIRVAEHRRFLDTYGNLDEDVRQFTQQYAMLVEKRSRFQTLAQSKEKQKARQDFLRFAIQEITEAKLQADEEDLLSDEEKKLSQYEKLHAELENILHVFSTQEDSFFSALKKSLAGFQVAVDIDSSLGELAKRFESTFYELIDINEELKSYIGSLTFDPYRFEEVQNRLMFLFKLKQKYLSTTQLPIIELIQYAQNAEKELDTLESSDEEKQVLEKEIFELERSVYTQAQALSTQRKAIAQRMSRAVKQILNQLGMQGIEFNVSITQKECTSATLIEQKCGPYGIDNIEFLISPNAGMPLRPLVKIASGGELSRIMLALKTVLNNADSVDTLIFDEIDTGIGGEVALAVGKHIADLAKTRQILCITHLASIAVFADTQVKIEKTMHNESTKTTAHIVTGEKRVQEVARMLSGDTISSASLEHAKTLLGRYQRRT